jgi:cation transport ATPase
MKKTFQIEGDCAACAQKMEDAAKKVAGVLDATVSFMTQKMKVEFEEGLDEKAVMQDVLKACKKVESDCEIYL